MESFLQRTELLIGKEAVEKLRNTRIALFGVGGVGGFTAEALARCGVGHIDLIDKDKVSVSNLNRQIVALNSTIGMYKTEVMASRIHDINPQATVNCINKFFLPENSNEFDFSQYDYVIDAIDTVTAKIELIVKCKQSGTKIISAMGTGNKTDPFKFCVTDIYKTSGCPLARVMRRELRKRNIESHKVLYSKAEIIKPLPDENGNVVTASVSFVPSVAGLMLAAEAVRDIIEK
ncbi:MAG: tRNA threonylcarbamoyladenosine dehydratase [Clostridiales bacterium]|nr:tRNA threonylcarbamoyladenosine dehydratase [Clostridiales bacterium]